MVSLTVEYIMSRKVISVHPASSLIEVYVAISTYNLSGVPVVDEENKLVGIITEYDLISKGASLPLSFFAKILQEQSGGLDNTKQFGTELENIKKLNAKDVMNIDPLTLLSYTALEDVLKTFRDHHRVNPIPVVDKDNKLIGIVSRYDVLKLLGILKATPSPLWKTSVITLRIGLGLTFLWIGGLILMDPETWGHLLQPWVVQLLPVSVGQALTEAAILDIIIGLFLLTGYLLAPVSLIAIGHLIIIIITTGFSFHSAIAARDIGLIAGLAVLFMTSFKIPNWTLPLFSRSSLSYSLQTKPVIGTLEVREDVKEYIKHMRTKGFSNEVITQELTKAGWSQEVISKIMET